MGVSNRHRLASQRAWIFARRTWNNRRVDTDNPVACGRGRAADWRGTLDEPAAHGTIKSSHGRAASRIGVRLFPRSAPELAFYIVLALTAAICEEFIFRGFVIAALLRAGLSSLTVVLLSSLMFGVAHLYQGKGGSAGTGILGTLFAVTRITYHSLFPVMVWHATLDIVAGIAGARFFGAADAASPESGDDSTPS